MPAPAETLPAIFNRTVAQQGDLPALHIFQDDAFHVLSWNDIAEDVGSYLINLAELGIQPGDRVVRI
jgi:hypothetical protein